MGYVSYLLCSSSFFCLFCSSTSFPSPPPLHTTITKKKKKERNMRRQTNALLIQVFVEPLTAVVESFRQWICTSFFFFLPITVALCDLAFVFFFFSALLLFKPFQSNDLKDVFSLAFNFFFFFFVCMCHFTRSFPHTSRFYLRHGIFCFSFFFFCTTIARNWLLHACHRSLHPTSLFTATIQALLFVLV